MKNIYLVWKCRPFSTFDTIIKVFDDLLKAERYKDRMMLETQKDRVYDSYGIVEGAEFTVQEMEIE